MPLNTKQLDTLSDVIGEAIDERFQRHRISFDPEMFGAEIGNIICEQAQATDKRIKELEARIEAMQKSLDIARKGALSFSGEFQQALPYQTGALVKHNGAMYAALKDIKAGGNLRDGSGWERLV